MPVTPDRYVKSVLIVIAACLVYLCQVLTPWPGASAQTYGPQDVVIVG